MTWPSRIWWVRSGRKVYAHCKLCDTEVCVNKRVLGSLHLCGKRKPKWSA